MSKDRKNRIPKVATHPVARDKSDRIRANPDDTNPMHPVWSIKVFDVDGVWGKSRIGIPEHLWDDLFVKLRHYESMTWGEILQDRQRNHSVEISRLSSMAQNRLSEIKQDDIDELFRLRLSGQQRVWGIREGNVFKLLWWDPDHEICPSHLKHT